MAHAIFKQSGCWYDGAPITEIWQTTWDDPGDIWPMCQRCVDHVRRGLRLRQAGQNDLAEQFDMEVGIDTRGLAGEWIDPSQSQAPMIGEEGDDV